MSLHAILPDSDIPDVLKRKLVFGDRAQINALILLEDKISAIDSTEGEEMSLYRVTVEVGGTYEKTVLAESEAAAERIVEDSIDLFDVDVGIQDIDAVKVKK